MPSSLSVTWALYPNSTGRSIRPLRIGRASGSCRLTSRVALSGVCPASRVRAWAMTFAVRSDGDRQLVQRPPQPAPHPAAEGPGQRPAAVAQHRGGLGRGFLREVSEFPGHPADHRVLSSRESFPRVRSLTAVSRTRRAAARRRSVMRVPVAPPAACTRRAVRTSLPTALASSPESVG